MLHLRSDLWRTLIKTKQIHNGYTQNCFLSFFYAQVQVRILKHTSTSSSFHENDSFCNIYKLWMFSIKNVTGSIGSCILANQPKFKYKLKPWRNFWKYKPYSTTAPLLAKKISSPFKMKLETTAVHKNMLSFSNEVTTLMNITQSKKMQLVKISA